MLDSRGQILKAKAANVMMMNQPFNLNMLCEESFATNQCEAKKKKSFEPIGVYRPLANNEGAKIFFLRPLPGSLKQKHRVLRDAQFLVW